MDMTANAARFSELHARGASLVLSHARDTGSAMAIVDAGANSVATSSRAVAAAQEFKDGEDTPIGLVEEIAARTVRAVDVPGTVDFEGSFLCMGHECTARGRQSVSAVSPRGWDVPERGVSGTPKTQASVVDPGSHRWSGAIALLFAAATIVAMALLSTKLIGVGLPN